MAEERFLVLRLGDGRFGVRTGQIREIVRVREVLRLRSMPRVVSGYFNYRGEFLPLLDLKERLNVDGDMGSYGLVVGAGTLQYGLAFDKPEELASFSGVEVLPQIGEEVSACLVGVGMHEQSMVILLDLDRLLSETEKRSLLRFAKRLKRLGDEGEIR